MHWRPYLMPKRSIPLQRVSRGYQRKGGSMRVGFFQFSPHFGKIARNLDFVSRRMKNIKADLMVLPEFFAAGYQFSSKKEVEDLSEEIPNGMTTQRLVALAADRKMWVVAGLVERDGKKFYNSAVMVGPGGYLGTYRKSHLFDEEKRWFNKGNTGFPVFKIGSVRVGIMICFDWIFPEASRSLARRGADIIAHPSNLVLPHCPDAMVTRSIENRIFSITANRIGSEQRGGRRRLTYIGKSQIVDPQGRILVRAASKRERLSMVEIHPEEARRKKINQRNDLFKDRRPDLYYL